MRVIIRVLEQEGQKSSILGFPFPLEKGVELFWVTGLRGFLLFAFQMCREGL